MKQRDKGMIQGLCIAIRFLLDDMGETVYADEIIGTAGITIDEMKKAEVDDYDFRPIEKYLIEKSAYER